jgi:glycosyl transferase family 25
MTKRRARLRMIKPRPVPVKTRQIVKQVVKPQVKPIKAATASSVKLPPKTNRSRQPLHKKRRLFPRSKRLGIKTHRSPHLNKAVNVHDGKWPEEFNKIFVVTIKDRRWNQAHKRLAHLKVPLIKWKGTDGRLIDKKAWQRAKIFSNHRMRRGQLGCYDSHMRVWKHVVDNNLPYGVIFEDDADLRPQHVGTIEAAFDQMKKHDPVWDVLFLSRSRRKRPVKRTITPNLCIPGVSWGCFAYVVSLRGAKNLLKRAVPMREALDDYVFKQVPRMRIYAVKPSLFHVVPVHSDTRNIK